MKYTAAFLLMLIGSFVQAQKVPEYETVKLKVLKIERIRQDDNESLWYITKLTMRDAQGIVYKASAKCIAFGGPTDVSGSPASCGHLVLPHIAETYSAKITFGGSLIYFGEISSAFLAYEIESEECPDERRGT